MSLFDARFFDLVVHTTEPTAGFAREAKRYGYSGIAVVNGTDNMENIPADFSIHRAAEISCKPSKLRDEIKRYRGSILIVRGGDEELDRGAVETPGLDILLQPAKFNQVLANAARDNTVAVGFNIGSVIRRRGEERIRELRKMRTNLKFVRKYGLAAIITCDAYSIYDIRSPRELAALASIFGMSEKEAVDAMSRVPQDILRRKSPDYVQEGVEII